MQVTEILNEGLKRAVRFTVPPEEIDAKVEAKLAGARPGISMPGFRKGAVPMAILKKKYGPELHGEAVKEIMDAAVAKHFEDSGDRPATRLDFKTDGDGTPGKGMDFDLTYEAFPEIPDLDLKDIELEMLKVAVGDAEVDEELTRIASQTNVYEAKDGPAETGDKVVIDYKGTIDGEEFEDGSAEGSSLVVGASDLLAGFAEGFAAAKAGDEIDIKTTFPEDFSRESLRGKEAVFSCKVISVNAPRPAAVDDELAKRFGAPDLGTLKNAIRGEMEARYAGEARLVAKSRLFDVLDGKVDFELPPTMVEVEARNVALSLRREQNPNAGKGEPENVEPDAKHVELAERRVRIGLLLREIGRKHGIAVSDAEIVQAAQTMAPHGQDVRKFTENILKDQGFVERIKATIFENKMVDFIFELAQVSEIEATKEDLEKASESLD